MKGKFSNHLQKIVDDDLKNHHFLVSVSGGVDSIVLLNLCLEIKLIFSVVHFHHGLRRESDDEFDYLLKYCSRKRIPFYGYHLDLDKSKSPQLQSRYQRREILNGLLEVGTFNYVMTGHHADDNVETIIMRLCRGSNINGLSGMKPINGQYIKPLLVFTKDEIIHYAESKNLVFFEDSSNLKNNYLRNIIRNTVIPSIKSHWDGIERGILKSADHSRKQSEFNKEILARILDQRILKENELIIYKEENKIIDDFVLYEYLTNLGASNKACEKFLANDPTQRLLELSDFLTIKTNNHVILIPRETSQGIGEFVSIESPKIHNLWNFNIDVKPKIRLCTSKHFIRPKGMKGRKKRVMEVLKDNKIPKEIRTLWPVVVYKGNEVYCIPGLKYSIHHLTKESKYHFQFNSKLKEILALK